MVRICSRFKRQANQVPGLAISRPKIEVLAPLQPGRARHSGERGGGKSLPLARHWGWGWKLGGRHCKVYICAVSRCKAQRLISTRSGRHSNLGIFLCEALHNWCLFAGRRPAIQLRGSENDGFGGILKDRAPRCPDRLDRLFRSWCNKDFDQNILVSIVRVANNTLQGEQLV